METKENDKFQIYGQNLSRIKKSKNPKMSYAGSITGYASIDKPWMKYYGEKVNYVDENISINDNLYEKSKKFSNMSSIRYFGHNISYGELTNKIDAFAKSFVAQGVKPGDIVTVCLPNVPEYGYIFFALNKIGAVSNWLDFRTGESELLNSFKCVNSNFAITFDGVCEKVNDAIFEYNKDSNSKIKNVLVIKPSDSFDDKKIKTFLSVKEKVSALFKKKSKINDIEMSLKHFLKSGENVKDLKPYKFEKNSTAAIVYTGGTTGTPKGVELTNENFNAMINEYKSSSIEFNPGESFLNFLPPWTAYGLAISLYLPIVSGVTSIFIPKLDPATYDKLVLKEKPTHTTGIPKNLEILVNSKVINADTDLSFFKTIAVGADILPVTLENNTNNFLKLHKSLSSIIKGYGMTEGCSTITTTSNNIKRDGSVGIPFIDNNVGIFDIETGKELKYNEKGEICFNGPTIMKQYLNNNEETLKILKTHDDGKKWIHSGDIGYIDNDGFVYIIDREKKMFVRSGFKIFPSIISENIMKNPMVKECATVGLKDSVEGKIPVSTIVLNKNCSNQEKEDIVSQINSVCKKELFEYYLPIKYVFADDLPHTLNGKVDFKKIEQNLENKKDNQKVKKLSFKK